MRIKLLLITFTILNVILTNCKIFEFSQNDDTLIKASVTYDDKTSKYTFFKDIYDETSAAFAIYKDNMMVTGWDTLALSSYQGEDWIYSDEVKAYAMGYLEGHLTHEKIWNHYQNCNAFFNGKEGKLPENAVEFLSKNREWVKKMHNEKDPYWHHAFLILRQYEGLIDAYNLLADTDKQITFEEALIMNSHDIQEVKYYKNPEGRPDFSKMSAAEVFEIFDKNNHCSGLMKVAADLSDVWFGHNTWTSFASMTRIFKEYRFKSNAKSEGAKTIAMSSYPGAINSIDDFYITDQDLYVTETTNTVFDKKLYDLLNPETLLAWHRAMIANRLALNAVDWTMIFQKNNSGTYNNQFQVLDLKRIDVENRKIEDHALWIVEQIPGFTKADDVTKILRRGYWPSYNSAYFKEVRSKAGYDDQLAQHPELRDALDYATCARANIFRRDQATVKDMESFKHIMRYNKFQTDPLSKLNPSFSIASRKDLDETSPDCRGATDAKVSSIKDIKGTNKKKIYLVSGPTTQDQEPFNTKTAKCKTAKEGQYVFNGLPEVYNFDWIEYETTLFGN